MSDLGHLLELLHTASSKPLSVRARVSYWVDNETYSLALRHWESMQTNGSIGHMMAGKGPSIRYAIDEYEIWHRRPGPFWRVKRGASETLIEGQQWWSNSFDGRFWTNVRPDGSIASNVGGDLDRPGLETMFTPSSLPAICQLESIELTTHLSRSAFAARGILRVDPKRGRHIFALGAPYADSLEIVVDAVSGVVLRAELFLHGTPFVRWEVTEIDFDDRKEDSFFRGPANAYSPSVPDDGVSATGCLSIIWFLVWSRFRNLIQRASKRSREP
jgi:hypothetical protein